MFINAQEENLSERSKIFSFNIGYGIEAPGGDLSERYGSNLKFSLGSQYLTGDNLVFELDFNLMFGNNVNEDPLSIFRNSNNSLIAANGDQADVFTRQRGLFIGGIVGKIFSKPNKQSGLRIAGGAGVLSHNLRFLDESAGFFQINGNYVKGYDRLTRGFALKQQLGYELHSKDGRINLNLVFEFTQGFTKNVREYQFDTGIQDKGRRLDLLYGLRATWMLPLIKRSVNAKPIYY
jgi:hypothetical protein